MTNVVENLRNLEPSQYIGSDFVSRFVQHDYTLVLLIVAMLVLSYFINFFLVRSFLGKHYQLFLMPGVVLHELSHLLFCVITGAKVVNVTLFDAQGGRVEHEKPKWPLIGQMLISFAPFVIGVALVYLMSLAIGLKGLDVTELKFDYSNLLQSAANFLAPIDFASWKTWVFGYLIVSVSVTLSPSKQDFKNIAVAILISILIYIALVFLNVKLDLSSLPIHQLVFVMSTVCILLILSLILSMILFVISKMIGKRR
jgi:hypothetical protein